MVVSSLSSGLYLVATPIGNLKDITLRALDVLRAVDVIACEDTRTSRVLLRHYDIHPNSLISYHDFSGQGQRQKIIDRIMGGASLALISDAGTPLIADPGYKLVQDCLQNNISVVPIPGASALIAGLIISGMPTDRFLFVGFINPKDMDWPDDLTIVGYVSCHDVTKVLAALAKRFGDRVTLTLSRELTKMFEGTFRGTPEVLQKILEERAIKDPKIMGGEWVLTARLDPVILDHDQIRRQMGPLVRQHGVKQAVAMAQGLWDVPRKTLYHYALEAAKDETQG